MSCVHQPSDDHHTITASARPVTMTAVVSTPHREAPQLFCAQ